MDTNVLEHLHVPQTTKPDFDLIDDDLRSRLFALYPPVTFLGSRNLAMLAVVSDTGLRREELVNIKLKNIDLDAQVWKVYSDKTEDWRYLPLTDEVTTIVRNHLAWRERYFKQSSRQRKLPGSDSQRERLARSVGSDHVFLAWDGGALTPHAFGEILVRASRKLGARIHSTYFVTTGSLAKR